MKGEKKVEFAAEYIRVSTHMQDELSPDAQQRLLTEYAKSNGYVVSKEHIFIEKGISGKKADKRPEFMRMISLSKQKPAPFKVILVWKFSRFARNQEESIVYKSLLRKQCGIEVISVSEPIIDGPFGSLIERIIEWMDEYYSVRLAGEVTRGMTEKALRGGYQARPPLGYRIPSHKADPVIVPEEAKIIELIFDLYVNQRAGFFDIARRLNALGYKTSHGKNFERRSVEYIIQNPTYCGMIRWNRQINETKEIRPESEWIVTEGKHPAIISKDLFNQAQERFRSEYTPRGARPSSSHKHWLSGLVKCPACGRTMVGKHLRPNKSGPVYCYFTCYGYSKGKCAAKTSISAAKLEPAVLVAIHEAVSESVINFEVMQSFDDSDAQELEALKMQLSRMGEKERRIKDAYRDGIDTLSEYKENKALLLREREELESEIERLSSPSASEEAVAEDMLSRVKNVYEILSSSSASVQLKNDAIRSIVSKIVYDKASDNVDIYYYYA